ncbi:hypothetical protein [Streptomyces sp. NBC_00347]|uniref:hypothetical protein n=1 Tax=Streptomyces sp. NBC_00347 TaxID=2975721 RepID=UPI0022596668|nr:hypothetical protein [Streptomyces sp. NBC_00347]MCX5129488.1 hypothetical protein [Streptomyces sp. NBC_00347]
MEEPSVRDARDVRVVWGPVASPAPAPLSDAHGARLGAAIAVLAGWVLVLVTLGTYVPGWAG